MHSFRTFTFLLALLLAPVAGAHAAPSVGGKSPSDRLEALFAEARINWERGLSDNTDRLPHLVDFAGPHATPTDSLLLQSTEPLPGSFALPRARDPFDPLAPGRPYPEGSTVGIMEIPAHLFFRTDTTSESTPAPLPGARGWVSVETRNPDLARKTLRSLRQIGFASIAPIPEPGLPMLAGLTLIGALLRRQRPSRP